MSFISLLPGYALPLRLQYLSIGKMQSAFSWGTNRTAGRLLRRLARLPSRSITSIASPQFGVECRCVDLLDKSRVVVPAPNLCSEGYVEVNKKFFSSVVIESTDCGPTKIVPFLLADIGEGIAEVELLQWFVQPGDLVSQFDRVCEVQSDKATVEITSRFDGVIESLNGKVGDMVSVGSPLLHIAVDDDGTTASEPSDNMHGASSSNDTSTSPPEPTLNNVDDEKDRLHIPQVASSYSSYDYGSDNGISESDTSGKPFKILATPAVRKLCMDHNIDLGTLKGTGPKGRVLKADLLKIINATSSTHVSGESKQFSAKSSKPSTSEVAITPGSDTIEPIRGYSRLMIKSMTASLQVPQMCYSDECNMNALKAVREDLKPVATEAGVKLSYLPFLIKAASLAMTDYPLLNSSINIEESTLTYHGDHNIGIAMDTPRGLAVPCLKHCQSRSILDIAKELSRLQEAAIAGNLSEDDITGVTFTLSNIGAIGGTYMSPIVTPPQVAIGAIGKIQRLPRFVEDTDQVTEANIMQISWGGDHRVVDGATMARFSNQWKAYIEKPMMMTFSMK